MKTSIPLMLLLAAIHLSAEGVPYQGLRQTETEHFKLIFENKDSSQAAEITGFCEEVYHSVTGFFDSYPEKITVVLNSRQETANGYFYPAPPHIYMYLTPPSVPEFAAGMDNWLKFLLVHELAHYVNMTIKEGFFYGLSKWTGSSVKTVPGGLLPGWAIEGIAVKLESELSGSRGRINNPFFELYSKGLIIDESFFTWKQAAYISSRPPDSRIYVAGALINEYLAENFGEWVFVDIYREFLRFPFTGFDRAVKKITGESTEEIFTSMTDELRGRYAGQKRNLSNFLSPEKEGDYFLPAVTEKGLLIYRSTPKKEPALVYMDSDTGTKEILVKTRLSDNLSYTSDRAGRNIVFSALDITYGHPGGTNVNADLYLFNTESKDIRRLTDSGGYRQPAISPDGKRLAAVQQAGQWFRLVEIDPDTGNAEILYESDRGYTFTPSFSPDGELLTFTLQEKGNSRIIIIDRSGRIFNLSSGFSQDCYFPVFEDNRSLLFTSQEGNSPGLYRYIISEDFSSGRIYRVLEDPTGIRRGVSTGKELIYSTYSKYGYILKTVPLSAAEDIEALPLETDITEINNKGTEYPETVPPVAGAQKYHEYPEHVFTLPLPVYYDPVFSGTVKPGLGAGGYFRSVPGNKEVSFYTALDLSTMQPAAWIKAESDWGPVNADYTLKHGYSEAGESGQAQQLTQQQILFQIPAAGRRKLGTSLQATLIAGIMNRHRILSDTDFQFFSQDTETSDNRTFMISGAGFSAGRTGADIYIAPPVQLFTQALLYNEFSNSMTEDFSLISRTTLNLPFLLPGGILRFSNVTTVNNNDNLLLVNNPRGFQQHTGRGVKSLGAADMIFTAASPDLPVAGGFSIQRIAFGIHAETVFYSPDYKSSLTWSKTFYAGGEIMATFNYITVFQTVGTGISFAVDMDNPDFSPENSGVYFFIGNNSLF